MSGPRPANWQAFTISVPVASALLLDPRLTRAYCLKLYHQVNNLQAAARAEFARVGALGFSSWEWEARPLRPGPPLTEEDLEDGAPVLLVGACEVRLPDDLDPRTLLERIELAPEEPGPG